MTAEPGPFATLSLGGGARAPLYLVRYDDDGRPRSPRTEAALRRAAAGGAFSDAIVLIHGWNNDFAAALALYRRWIGALADLLVDHPLPAGRPFAPLFVGAIWPSAALLAADEHGPDIAAGADPAADDAEAAALEATIDDLAAAVAPADRARFDDLVDRPRVTAAEAEALAAMLAPLFAGGDADLGAPDDAERTPEAIVAAARALGAPSAPIPTDLDDFGTVGGVDGGAPPGGAPALAGDDGLDVRDLLRVLTVWRMKDRAGRVGAKGVGPLLRGLLADTAALGTRVHLVGHSFGARVALTAIAHPPEAELPRPVASALLLQPAVNHLCFAADAGAGRPGGYRVALGRVERPILSTFSAHDLPLRLAFHLALVRPRDLGEAQIAAGAPGDPPSRYAALGGYGPRGVGAGARVEPIRDPGDPYDLAEGLELLALDGSRTIHGHGDVAGPGAAWALRALLVD